MGWLINLLYGSDGIIPAEGRYMHLLRTIAEHIAYNYQGTSDELEQKPLSMAVFAYRDTHHRVLMDACEVRKVRTVLADGLQALARETNVSISGLPHSEYPEIGWVHGRLDVSAITRETRNMLHLFERISSDLARVAPFSMPEILPPPSRPRLDQYG